MEKPHSTTRERAEDQAKIGGNLERALVFAVLALCDAVLEAADRIADEIKFKG